MHLKSILPALTVLLLAAGTAYATPPAAAAKSTTAALAAATTVAVTHHFIWRLTKGHGEIYLVGSIHTLNPNDYPLPDVMENAFQHADALVEEVNLTMLDTTTVQQEAMRMATYPRSESLQTTLPPELYKQVVQSAKDLGLDMQEVDRFRPWFVSMLLLNTQLQHADFDPSDGVDNHFADEAQMLDKPVIGLETARYQLDLLAGLPEKTQQAMLQDAVEESAHFDADVHALISAWEKGDAAAIAKITHKDFANSPIAYQRLILERNRAWFARLQHLAQSGRQYFVVVGAAHLVGPDGLLMMFERAGYQATQL
ncbi:MAG: TraB/GumN family protein [Gammaproteobacteria bacterium]